MQPAMPRPLPVIDGYLACPKCRKNKRLLKINGDEVLKNVELYCRDCKRVTYVDAVDGRCYLSSDTKYV